MTTTLLPTVPTPLTPRDPQGTAAATSTAPAPATVTPGETPRIIASRRPAPITAVPTTPPSTSQPGGPTSTRTTAPPTATAAPPEETPITRDDFNQPGLDTSRWGVYDGYDPATSQNWLAGNAVIEEGILALHGQSDGSIGGISSKIDRTYGLWEVNAQFPTAADRSLCPVFMLWPANDSTWPAAGELDFAEIYDPYRQYVEGWLHYDSTDKQEYTGRHPVDLTQWHTFSVEWRPDHVTYFVDGVPWWTTSNHIPTEPMHLAMQLNNMSPSGTDFVPTRVNIGSVRIYQ